MKIKTTQTQTQTKEIEITFPTFTKVAAIYSNAFYCIKNENQVIRIEQYEGTKIVTISHFSHTETAFTEGFEFIDKTTFFNIYDAILGGMCNDMEELQASLEVDERTDFEIEQERKEAIEEDKANDYCDNRD